MACRSSCELEPVGGRADVALIPRQNFGVVGTWEKEGTTRVGLECYYSGEQRLEYNPYRDVSRPYVSVPWASARLPRT